jgi:purine-binding chemotaxis protein CheW
MAALTEEKKQITRDIYQFVCFKLANEEYAIDIEQVQEVIRVPLVTRIPQMPDFALGVINIRGNVVPLFDLRRKFHLVEKPFDEHTKFMVVRAGGSILGLVVDMILDNVKLSSKEMDAAPDVKMQVPRDCVQGVGVLDGRMIVLLNLERVNQEIERSIKKDH